MIISLCFLSTTYYFHELNGLVQQFVYLLADGYILPHLHALLQVDTLYLQLGSVAVCSALLCWRPAWLPVPYVVSVLFLFTTFAAYCLSLHLQARTRAKSPFLAKWIQPTVFTLLAVFVALKGVAHALGITFLEATDLYKAGAPHWPLGVGDALTALLMPAVVSMGFGMFLQRDLLVTQFTPLASIPLLAAGGSLLLVALGCRVLAFAPPLAFSLVPHMAMTPLALESLKLLTPDGNPEVTAAVASLSAISGSMFGRSVLDATRQWSPLFRGLAVGCCAGGIGTGMLGLEEPESQPFGAIGFAFVGLYTVLLCSMPLFRTVLYEVLGLVGYAGGSL